MIILRRNSKLRRLNGVLSYVLYTVSISFVSDVNIHRINKNRHKWDNNYCGQNNSDNLGGLWREISSYWNLWLWIADFSVLANACSQFETLLKSLLKPLRRHMKDYYGENIRKQDIFARRNNWDIKDITEECLWRVVSQNGTVVDSLKK